MKWMRMRMIGFSIGGLVLFLTACASQPVERMQHAVTNGDYDSAELHSSRVHDLLFTRLYVSEDYLSGKRTCDLTQVGSTTPVRDDSWRIRIHNQLCPNASDSLGDNVFVENLRIGASRLRDVVQSLLGDDIPPLDAEITTIPPQVELTESHYRFASDSIRLAYAFHEPGVKSHSKRSQAYIDLGTLAHEYFHMYLQRQDIEFPNNISEETAASLFGKCVTVQLAHAVGADMRFKFEAPNVDANTMREYAKHAENEKQSLLGGVIANIRIISALGKADADPARAADRTSLTTLFKTMLREKPNVMAELDQ